MCLDPVTIGFAVATAVVTSATTMVSQGLQVAAQNAAAQKQYQFQQQQQNLVTQNAIQNMQQTNAMQSLQAQHQAVDAFNQAQQATIQNQQKQATAVASGATAGITGTPLQQLFNNYQVSVGNIASNLNTTYNQLNQNLFFQSADNTLEAQSRINQSTPAAPYMAQFSPIPGILSGIGTGISTASQGYQKQSLNTLYAQQNSAPQSTAQNQGN